MAVVSRIEEPLQPVASEGTAQLGSFSARGSCVSEQQPHHLACSSVSSGGWNRGAPQDTSLRHAPQPTTSVCLYGPASPV